MKPSNNLFLILATVLLIAGCNQPRTMSGITAEPIPVIFDTDANNELDDQHALAYLLLNRETFDVIGVTVNATWSGGPVEEHYREAERVLRLCNMEGSIPLYKGADGNFTGISGTMNQLPYDGSDAVEFIIREAFKARDQPLVILAVGKLTNVALAAAFGTQEDVQGWHAC